MSNHFVKPSASSPERRLRRLQFRTITEEPEEQATLKMSVTMPDRGKQRGEFLPARQQERAEPPPAIRISSESNRNNQYKLPVAPQIEAVTAQQVHTPASAP